VHRYASCPIFRKRKERDRAVSSESVALFKKFRP